MKKLFCLVLSLMLVLSAATAFAAVEYSLPEKWQRQVDANNGITGTVTLNVSGTADWVQLVAPLSGVPLQVRAIHSDELFQYRIYVEDGEEMAGLTQLYGDGETMYLKSDLLPEVLLSLTTGGDVMERLLGSEGTNPSLYSAILNIVNIPETTWEGKWMPALAAYEDSIELWLESYASAPSVKRTESGATVLVRYDVPADAVKEQIKLMWEAVLQDGTLLPMLRTKLTEEQQDAYLNPNLLYYYDQVIDSLALSGNVVLEREMTAKGDIVRTDMTFPLNLAGWQSLRFVQQGTTTTVALAGSEYSLELEMDETVVTPDSSGYRGKVCVTPALQGQQGVAAEFTLVEIRSSSVDEDTRSHDVNTWTLKVQPDAEKSGEGWLAFDPVELYCKLHMHSKSLQYMPVSIELELEAKLKDATAGIMVDIKTRSPWILDNLPTEGARDVSTMPKEELTQMLTDLFFNGITRMVMLNPESVLPAPDAATTTDLAGNQTEAGSEQ